MGGRQLEFPGRVGPYYGRLDPALTMDVGSILFGDQTLNVLRLPPPHRIVGPTDGTDLPLIDLDVPYYSKAGVAIGSTPSAASNHHPAFLPSNIYGRPAAGFSPISWEPYLTTYIADEPEMAINRPTATYIAKKS